MKAVNLIPADQRGGSGISAGRSGGSVYAVFGLIAGLALLALLYGLSAHKISSSKTEVASLNAKAQEVQARASALSPYTSFAAMREQRAQAVDTLVNSRFDWATAFHELGRVLPANVSLTSLDGTVGPGSSTSSASTSSKASTSAASAAASSATSATPPGSVPTFTIAGCATSQTEVALMLDRLRLIDGVSEVSLQSSATSGSAGGGGGGGGGAGGCEASDPVFNVTVTFDALPSLPANGSTAHIAAATSGTPAIAATSSSSTATVTGGAR
jgi:Tfp pilus assembly protein PilN